MGILADVVVLRTDRGYLLYLALRHRSLTVWTAANLAMPQGGVVGESKHEIMLHLPSQWVVANFLVAPGDPKARTDYVVSTMKQRCWCFPIILKPDASQRGFGLKRVHDLEQIETYFALSQGCGPRADLSPRAV